jgi:hypothetical protein
MSKEQFPGTNQEKDAKVIEALIKSDEVENETAAILAGVNYISSPKIIKKDPQLELKLPETSTPTLSQKENLEISLKTGSISSRLVKIIDKKYSHLNIGLVRYHEPEERPYLSTNVNNSPVIEIFSDPILEVLEMIDPEVDMKVGYDLEENGLLPKGVTDSSYARYLQKFLKEQMQLSWEEYNYDPDSDKEDDELEEEFTEQFELDELLERGVRPLTDKQIDEILEQIIKKALKKNNIK